MRGVDTTGGVDTTDTDTSGGDDVSSSGGGTRPSRSMSNTSRGWSMWGGVDPGDGNDLRWVSSTDELADWLALLSRGLWPLPPLQPMFSVVGRTGGRPLVTGVTAALVSLQRSPCRRRRESRERRNERGFDDREVVLGIVSSSAGLDPEELCRQRQRRHSIPSESTDVDCDVSPVRLPADDWNGDDVRLVADGVFVIAPLSSTSSLDCVVDAKLSALRKPVHCSSGAAIGESESRSTDARLRPSPW